jgi:hypothetical protein
MKGERKEKRRILGGLRKGKECTKENKDYVRK